MDLFTTYFSGHWPLLAGMVASILFAALIAASETAMLFANKVRLHQMADEGNGRAEAALRLDPSSEKARGLLRALSPAR